VSAFVSLRNLGSVTRFCSTLAGCRFATTPCPIFPEIPPGSRDGCGLPDVFDPEFPDAIAYCPDYQRHGFAFQVARSFGFYDGGLARTVVLLKHEQIEPPRKWFAKRLATLVDKEAERQCF
jgi:hypothetical protein